MKKLYILMAFVLSASLLLTACGAPATATQAPAPVNTTAPAAPADTAVPAATTASSGTAPDCTQANVFCVGVVTDVGKVDDKSFNQSAWEGVQNAKKDGNADWIPIH